jgi:hypothetical protein
MVAVGFSETSRVLSRKGVRLVARTADSGFVFLATCKRFKSRNSFGDIPDAQMKGAFPTL